MQFTAPPIGVIQSPFTDRRGTPIQPSRSQSVGRLEVYPEFADGLHDVEGFSHLVLLYVFHHSEEYSLMVKPHLDARLRGLFATRYPSRPNPIGLSVVSLLRTRGNVLEIEGVDVLDGTPLLDIKPHIPMFDFRANVRAGWYDQRSVQGG